MKTMHILVVDDEPGVRLILEMCLGSVSTWTVDLASSAEEALDRIRVAPPDLILLDVVMPNVDGLAALARFRAEPATRSTPVIFVTGRVEERDVDRFVALGAAGVVAKPFDPMLLPDRIRSILEGFDD